MSDSSIRFTRPQRVPDLKSAKLWSLAWVQETFGADAEFRFFICQKVDDGYIIHGQADEATDAFNLRKKLADELGAKLFIRAKRAERRATFSVDSDEAYDAMKDFYNEGRATHEVPTHLQPAFRHFLRSQGRSAR